MTVTRATLARTVYDSLPSFHKKIMRGHGKQLVTNIIERTIEEIKAATLRGDDVELRNFVHITTRARAPQLVYCRLGDNPGFKSTRPYVYLKIRPSQSWKRVLAKEVEKDFVTDKIRVERRIRELEEAAPEIPPDQK